MAWSEDNNLALNATKTKEIIIDFRRKKVDPQPLFTKGSCVERVPDFKFLGVHIEEHLTWGVHTTAVIQKAQQRLYFPEH